MIFHISNHPYFSFKIGMQVVIIINLDTKCIAGVAMLEVEIQ